MAVILTKYCIYSEPTISPLDRSDSLASATTTELVSDETFCNGLYFSHFTSRWFKLKFTICYSLESKYKYVTFNIMDNYKDKSYSLPSECKIRVS